ncbi:unnamed protein product, partial [Prorocentrum cordatum]
ERLDKLEMQLVRWFDYNYKADPKKYRKMCKKITKLKATTLKDRGLRPLAGGARDRTHRAPSRAQAQVSGPHEPAARGGEARRGRSSQARRGSPPPTHPSQQFASAALACPQAS